MPEYLKKVYAIQFKLTEAQKADIFASKEVFFDGQLVKHGGSSRFHVLINKGDILIPIYENQWLVKDSGDTQIYWEPDFNAKFQAVEKEIPVPEEVIGKFTQPVVVESVAPEPVPELIPDPVFAADNHEPETN